jgi:hypothetical protein
VSGDYTIPAGAPLPRSAASLALPPAAVPSTAAGKGARGAAAPVSPPVAAFDPASGRWRIQVPPTVAAKPAAPSWNLVLKLNRQRTHAHTCISLIALRNRSVMNGVG